MNKKEHEEHLRKAQFKEREAFLLVYSEFDKFLSYIGFRNTHYMESATVVDNDFWPELETLYSVEHYKHDALDISIRFLRERHNHVFYLVVGYMQRSVALSLDEMKTEITRLVHDLKTEKLQQLNAIRA